jgi:hypothetical protein
MDRNMNSIGRLCALVVLQRHPETSDIPASSVDTLEVLLRQSEWFEGRLSAAGDFQVFDSILFWYQAEQRVLNDG